MEETHLGSTEMQGFQSQNSAAKSLLRENYVNQYKVYYDGCFNMNKWKDHVYSRLKSVNQCWDHQYTESFSEFRENPRKVTFDDNILFHDNIDTELENEDKDSSNSSCENGDTNFLNKSFIVNRSDTSDFHTRGLYDEMDSNDSMFPQSSRDKFSIRPECFLNYGDVVSSLSLSPMQDDIQSTKSDSAPNLISQTDSDLTDFELDLKASRSDTIMAGTNNCNPAKKSSKNRVGTPRFLSKSSNHSSDDPSQLLEIDSVGKGDEETEDKNIDMEKKKAEDIFIPLIPIHSSVTKMTLRTEGDATFKNILFDQLPLEPLPLSISQDLVYPVMSFESGAKSGNQLHGQIGGNLLPSLPIPAVPPVKELRKVKRISKSSSDRKKKSKKPEVKQKSPASVKPVKKEKPMTLYIRRENARLQGQRLFNEIKEQISKHDVDKKVLSTIFNKQFVSLLLSGEAIKKYRANSGSINASTAANLQTPKDQPSIAIGSKWATKPVDNIRMTAAHKSPAPAPVTPPKSNTKSNKTVALVSPTPKLQKEKIEDKKSKPGLNTIVDKEKMKLSDASASAYAPTTFKKKSPRIVASEKSQKQSKSQIPKKIVEISEAAINKVLSPKKIKPRIENVEVAKVDKPKTIVNQPTLRTIIPTKIPKHISNYVKDTSTKQTLAEKEKLSILHFAEPEKVELLKKISNSSTGKSERPLTAPPTNPLDYLNFERWITESKKFENIRNFSNGDLNSMKLSVGDERELKILRSIKRNPQMLDAYTTYRFGGPLSPTELERIMKRL